MKQSESKTGMPLHLWVLAFIISIVVLSVIYFLLIVRDNRIGEKFEFTKAEGHFDKQDASLDIYILGSSLTNCALIQHNTFDSTISGRKELINYKTVVWDGANLQLFNSKIKEIRELRPKYLFIESNIACVDFSGNDYRRLKYFRVRLARIPLYFINMRINALKLLNNPVPVTFIEQNKINMDFGNLKVDSFENIGARFRVRKVNEFPEWKRFFEEAAESGIKIFLLEMPRSLEAEQSLPIEYKHQFNALVEEYHNKYNIGYICFPDKLPQNKYYLDRAHFNKEGSYYYCEWLMKELVSRNIIKTD